MKYGAEEHWRGAAAANDEDDGDSPSTQELPGILQSYLRVYLLHR